MTTGSWPPTLDAAPYGRSASTVRMALSTSSGAFVSLRPTKAPLDPREPLLLSRAWSTPRELASRVRRKRCRLMPWSIRPRSRRSTMCVSAPSSSMTSAACRARVRPSGGAGAPSRPRWTVVRSSSRRYAGNRTPSLDRVGLAELGMRFGRGPAGTGRMGRSRPCPRRGGGCLASERRRVLAAGDRTARRW